VAEDGTGAEVQRDTDEDRYCDARRAVSMVVADERFPEGDVERIELTLLGNGEVNWRAWPAKADEPELGHYPEGTIV
jgi:hypothetical protein